MKVFICCIFTVLCLGRVWAQPVRLTDKAASYAVTYPFYLEDTRAAFSIEQVQLLKDSFLRSPVKTPDFKGNMSAAIWYRFDVINQSNTSDWLLEIKGSFMHRITVYQTDSGRLHQLSLNADNQFSQRPIRSNNLVFPVPLLPGEQKTIYVRSTSKTLIRTSMRFSTMQTLYEKSIFGSYADGFFTALAVALLLYNLYVYFTLKEKVYLYYIGYISTSILHNNLVAGHAQVFLPWLDWLNSTTIVPVVSFFSILFTNSFLRTRKLAPLIYRLKNLLIAFCALPLFFYMLGWYQVAILLVSLLAFVVFAYWVTAGIMAYRKGFQPAGFYLIGFGALAVMSVVFELNMQGILEERYWTGSSLFIGAAAEAIVLSFALASKINFYKREKEQIQEQAYQQAVNFSRDLIGMQEAERKRIASELHDSLGQKLVLIKNKILKASLPAAGNPPTHDDSLPGSVAEAIQEIRTISYGLRPYQLDLLGLTSSINSLVEESFDAANISYRLDIDAIDDVFNNEASINIYRIVQECLNNIIKHSSASHVDVSLKNNRSTIDMVIKDNGAGFDANGSHSGFGLKGIRERLHILQGAIDIDSVPAHGTRVTIHIPIPNKQP